WLGRTSLQPMWDAWEAGDRRGAVAAITDETVDELIVHGDWDRQRTHIKEYMDAGIDTAFLSLYSAEPDPVERRKHIHRGMSQLAQASYRCGRSLARPIVRAKTTVRSRKGDGTISFMREHCGGDFTGTGSAQ